MKSGDSQPKLNIKWSYGEPYQKSSARRQNPFAITSNNDSLHESGNQSRREFDSSISNFAIGESNQKQLEREFVDVNSVPEILYGNVAKDSFQTKQNKREENNNKMLEREMMAQTNQNPFLLKNDYLDDLSVQDEFLKPRNSSFDPEMKQNYKRK